MAPIFFPQLFLLSDDGPIVVSEGKRAVSTRRSSPHCCRADTQSNHLSHRCIQSARFWGVTEKGERMGTQRKKEKENSDADDDGGFVCVCVFCVRVCVNE